MTELTLYSMPSSGNSYKVRLLLALLGQPYVHVDCEDGSDALSAAKSAGKTPLGKVPALELADGTILAESNAILTYLADGTPWLPDDRLARAQVLAWMFFEQNRHEPVIAVRASLRMYASRAHLATPDRLAELLQSGHEILQIMEDQLCKSDWLTGDNPTIADIALYAYTHTAGSRGGFEMGRFPSVTNWCTRFTDMPGYIGLEDIPK
ncbi:MAG: glutathione S-transferase family protein [Rhodobacteraceae bacterium]|nr:glutathione S-transferase family protein [Paracoccaceae bacterium]